MHVLALCSQKGGSGKTTLSGHLAVQAKLAGAGTAALIDPDPQGSLAASIPKAARPWKSRKLAAQLDQQVPGGFFRSSAVLDFRSSAILDAPDRSERVPIGYRS
jgi:Mrp family chromosome partitioning ATPase